MSTLPATRSRWMDWKPRPRIMVDSAESEPTKPSEPGSVGFDGTTLAESPEIETGPDPAALSRAHGVLNRNGVRLMNLAGVSIIGIWSDLDGPQVRAALCALGLDGVTVRYLDGDGIPMLYKVRRVDGEPVPLDVLAEMERWQVDLMERSDPMTEGGPMEHVYPWNVRDRILNEMGWRVEREKPHSGAFEGGDSRTRSAVLRTNASHLWRRGRYSR